MKKILLPPKTYKYLGLALIFVTILILLWPWLSSNSIIYWIIGLYLIFFGDWLVTFLERHSINAVLSLILGYTLAFIVVIALCFYNVQIIETMH